MKFTTVSENKEETPITITIDVGHGGYDPGAVGPTGVLEKDISLSISLKVGEIPSKNGINVVYTRTSDKDLHMTFIIQDYNLINHI